MIEKLYKIGEAAELLGVTVASIRRWEKAGKIKCIRTAGGHRRIPESEVIRLRGQITAIEFIPDLNE
jgi:putative resolvase